jgi:uncharacterized protein YdhG (YjbR/CyaY superfamily)
VPVTSVDDYLAGVSEPSRTALQRLRETIRAMVPEATEAISYQIPTVKLRGRSFVAYAAFKDHCSLFPMSMAVIDSHRRELKRYLASKGTLQFQPHKPLPEPFVESIVRARVAEVTTRNGC